MVIYVRTFALLAGLAILLSGHAAHAQYQDYQAQDKQRYDFCLKAADAMLRLRSTMENNELTIHCLCTVPQDAIKTYMDWCMKGATDKDFVILKERIDHAPCSDPENMKMCINP